MPDLVAGCVCGGVVGEAQRARHGGAGGDLAHGDQVRTCRCTGLFEDPVVKLREELGIAAVVNGDVDDGDAGLG